MTDHGFLAAPDLTPEAQRLFDGDVAEVGHVMNASRMWAYGPGIHDGIFELLDELCSAHGLTLRQRGILVTACASTLGDSYCALSWGGKLAGRPIRTRPPECSAGTTAA
jgi:hypothetical protein